LRRLAAIDIGTNTIRMLVADRVGRRTVPVLRRRHIVGLGRRLRETGRIGDAEFAAAVEVLRGYRREMERAGVAAYRACGTACLREADNRAAFLEASSDEGIDVEVIRPGEEARLTWEGIRWAVAGRPGDVAMDIGGGSTEFVTADTAVSIDIGSVRLTERSIPSRPAPAAELDAARDLVARLFETVDLEARTLIGVAGTWTSLAAIALELPEYSRDLVDGYRMQRDTLTAVIESLSGKSVEETAAIPSLDPKRAPVILAGSLVAEGVMDVLGAERVLVSEHDSLDGAAMELLALP